MLQLLPQSNTLTINTTNAEDAVRYINDYIDKYHCEKLNIDLSFFNALDACHVSTMCSTKHFVKYPSGKISWKISSELTQELSKDLELGNSEYII